MRGWQHGWKRGGGLQGRQRCLLLLLWVEGQGRTGLSNGLSGRKVRGGTDVGGKVGGGKVRRGKDVGGKVGGGNVLGFAWPQCGNRLGRRQLHEPG